MTMMKTYAGRVMALELDLRGQQSARVGCPRGAVPDIGQVVMAVATGDQDEGPAVPLFLGGQDERGFLGLTTDGRLPPAWLPGVRLLLRGPSGQGFHLPGNVRRLGLAALGDTAGRLLPLTEQGLARGADVALFTDRIPPSLPASVEFQPLSGLPEALAWMDFLALDLPRERLPDLRHLLRLEPGDRLGCMAQALVTSALPCGGLASCGACAVPTRRGWKLVCEDGPVIDLNELDW